MGGCGLRVDLRGVQHELRELERQLTEQSAAAQQELSQQRAAAAADGDHAQVNFYECLPAGFLASPASLAVMQTIPRVPCGLIMFDC